MNLDTELDPQEQAERAWNRATSFSFRGKPLQVWDYLRKTAAGELGLKWGNVPEKDFVKVGNVRVSYRGIERDAVIVLWLMHQDAATCRSARSNPAAFEQAIDEWAEEQHLFSNALDFDEEGMRIFRDLMTDEQASTALLKPAEGEHLEEPSGQKKRRSSPRRNG